MDDFGFLTAAWHKFGFKVPLLRISNYKILIHNLIYTISHYHVATMMVTYFYFMKRCASLRFQKFESLIFFHARSEYGKISMTQISETEERHMFA